jgi:hypothetical protein
MVATFSVTSPPLQFTLLVAEHPLVELAPNSWHTYIEDLLAPTSENIDVDVAKKVIQQIVDENKHEIASQFGMAKKPDEGRKRAATQPGDVLFNGNLHCEMVLSSLKKYPPAGSAANEDLSKFISVRCDVVLPTFIPLTKISDVGSVHDFRIKVMLPHLLGVLKDNAGQRYGSFLCPWTSPILLPCGLAGLASRRYRATNGG